MQWPGTDDLARKDWNPHLLGEPPPRQAMVDVVLYGDLPVVGVVAELWREGRIAGVGRDDGWTGGGGGEGGAVRVLAMVPVAALLL